MKHPNPNSAGIAGPHWQAARLDRLEVPYCTACAAFRWPPRAYCPGCGGRMQWRTTSGRGRIATFSIVRRAPNAALSDEAPYAVAFIALEEGVRLFGNVVGAPADSLRIGMPVRCGFEPAQDPALPVPVFMPDEGER